MPATRKFSHQFKRFLLWLKQAILLGRVDWRKASDDASPPRLSQREREELQPHFDVNAIRPRNVSAANRPAAPADPVQPEAGAAETPFEPDPAEPAAGPAHHSRRGRVFRRKKRKKSSH